MLMHQIHRCKCLVIMSCTSSSIIAFFESFNADRNEEVTDSEKILTEFFINQSAISKCMERNILMFLTEADDVIFTDQRFSTGKQVSIDAKLLSFCDDLIHRFIRKIQLVSVFCCPTSSAVQVAGGRRIHQDDPRDIAVIFFLHFIRSFVSHEACFKTCVQKESLQDVRVNFMQDSFYIVCPFAVRVVCNLAEHFIRRCFPILTHDFFNLVNQRQEYVRNILCLAFLNNGIQYFFKCFSFHYMC